MAFSFFGKKKDPLSVAREEAEARPRDSKAALNLALLLRTSGDVQGAVAEYLRAAELFKVDGFLPRAVAAAQQAVQASPRNPSAWAALADLHAARKHKEDEREALKKLVEALRAEGRTAEAAALKTRIEALGPGR